MALARSRVDTPRDTEHDVLYAALVHLRLVYELFDKTAQFFYRLHRVVHTARHVVVKLNHIAAEVHQSEVDKVDLNLDTDKESRFRIKPVQYRTAALACLLLAIFHDIAKLNKLGHSLCYGWYTKQRVLGKLLNGRVAISYKILNNVFLEYGILAFAA